MPPIRTGQQPERPVPSRQPSRLPYHWTGVRYAPGTLPATWPPPTPLFVLEAEYMTYGPAGQAPHGVYSAEARQKGADLVRQALAAPLLWIPDFENLDYAVRGHNAHRQLAFDGDSRLHDVLVSIGKGYNLSLVHRHTIVSEVGSNATLSQIAVESGILQEALRRQPEDVYKLANLPQKVAADIVEAMIAATEEALGLEAATEWVTALTRPWVERVLVKRCGIRADALMEPRAPAPEPHVRVALPHPMPHAHPAPHARPAPYPRPAPPTYPHAEPRALPAVIVVQPNAQLMFPPNPQLMFPPNPQLMFPPKPRDRRPSQRQRPPSYSARLWLGHGGRSIRPRH